MSLACPNRTSMLSLPPELRIQIYREAGLCYGRQVILPRSHYMIGRYDDHWKHSDWMKPMELEPSLKLFLVCKTFYSEASAVFYSENRFYLYAQDATDLESLLRLKPTSIAYLTHLVIQLNSTPCFEGTNLWPGQARCKRGSTSASSAQQDEQNLVMKADFIYLLTHWQLPIKHIMKHVTSDRLKLYLTCDIDNTMVASIVLLPLTQGKALAECFIHLNSKKDLVSSQMAREMAFKAMRKPDPTDGATPFRYLDLPVEIRHKILMYTDLITEHREVQWNSEEWFHLPHHRGQYECEISEYHCDCCEFRACAKLSHNGCFCQRYHSVSTLRCQCWAPPVSLFLVCKAMRDDAETIFFQNNRFIIGHQIRTFNTFEFEPRRNQVSWFLQSLPRAIHHLRDLEIVFPYFEEGCYDASEASIANWTHAIEHMQFKCNLPALKLKIFMLDERRYDMMGISGSLPVSETRTIAQIHRRLLWPLRILIRCKRLFLNITHPEIWLRCYQARAAEGYKIRIYRPSDKAWEDELGRSIFGEDYQRLTKDREREWASQWLELYRALPD